VSDSDDVAGGQPDPTPEPPDPYGTPPAAERPPRYGEPGYVSPYAPPSPSPYGQPSYGYGTPHNMPPRPATHLVGAILTTLFCCLPGGIVSIVYASKVDSLYRVGDFNGALRASSSAKFWMTISIVVGLVVGVIWAVVLASSGSDSLGY
jgi:hypothetical protein